MTKINKLVVHGFKSFAKHTELLFGKQFNCVLGPNGSGKSNVLDALCFVLGRLGSKSLRAEKSANLIYNGGKTKKPMKEGEVSIYFDNSNKLFAMDEKEIKVTRIIRQNGQSKYKINNKTSTRQQIIDLLSVARIKPDGYNIILQGDIVRFVEMSTVERRKIIEQIAGISVYEEKKDKALRELNRVEEKLNEAQIILAERETYLKELKKERNQALKFKELRDRTDSNKASYIYVQIQEKEKEINALDKKIADYKKRLTETQQKITDLKTVIQDKKKDAHDITTEIEEKGEKEQVSLHKQVEQLKVELATDKGKIENYKNEIKRVEQRKNELDNELKEQKEKVAGFEEEKEALVREKRKSLKEQKLIDVELKEFRKKNEIDNAIEIEKEIEGIDKESDDVQKEINELREKQQNLLREKDRFELQIQGVDDQINKVLEVEKENIEQVSELKKKKEKFKKATLELNKLLNEDSNLAAQVGSKRQELAKNREKLAKLEARNVSARERIASNIAVKRILELKKKMKGIHGVVSDLGDVSSKYGLALEVAAGPRLNSIVVENDKVAADAISYLKKNKLGVASFIPLNKIKARDVDNNIKKFEKANGVHGFAIDLIEFDSKYKKVFSYVFGNTLITDNIDVARRIGIGNARMVTLDGDLADISGVMRGGFRRDKGKAMAFKEKEFTKELKELKLNVDESEKLLRTFAKRREEIEEKINKLRESKAHLEGDVIKIEKSLHLESGDLDASKKEKEEMKKRLEEVDKELEELSLDVSDSVRKLAQIKSQKQELRAKITQLKNPRLVAELNAFEEKKSQIKERLIKFEAEAENIEKQIKMAAPEKEKINDIVKQLDKEIENFDSTIKLLAKKIRNDKEELQRKEKMAQQFYNKYKKLFNKREQINNEMNKAELKIESLRGEDRGNEIQMNNLSLEEARLKGEMSGLQTEFKQYEGVKINTNKTEKQLKYEIDKFQKITQDMGAVNMKALEIYDNVEREYHSLLQKREKLGVEKGDVLMLINEIEGKKKERFVKTMDIVNKNFQNIFSQLSHKGEASLVLENPENPFEEGLLIRVRITGQKYLDIRSLSGGEKTMTALAFIFAIQEHEPAYFYVLDEVDAALDKHNSEKLARLLRMYCDKAQYVIISHNDQIISESDNLYGVSMNQHGVSNVVSLKI